MVSKRALTKAGTVTVTFDLPAAVRADCIALCGDFNGWSRERHLLKRNREGVWRVSIALKPGRSYRFRYLIDGAGWENDWTADGYLRNEFGGEDSVVVIP